jgi:hypothetical protein
MKYKGELTGFPDHIVQAMLDEQERQGNPRNVKIFEICVTAPKDKLGFDWREAILDEDIWHNVITNKEFHLIPNPKNNFKPYPKKMIVGDSKHDLKIDNPFSRTVLGEYNGKFMAIIGGEEKHFGMKSTVEKVMFWKCAIDIDNQLVEDKQISDSSNEENFTRKKVKLLISKALGELREGSVGGTRFETWIDKNLK